MIFEPRVVLVTATGVVPADELVRRIEAAASLPSDLRTRLAVELRDPELASRDLLALGRRLRAATRAIGAALIVNDRLDLARDLEADGVHLGRRSVSIADARAFLGATCWVSVACHSVSDIALAARNGTNAAMISPIFASPGKGTPLGEGAIRLARAAIAPERPIHLIALGGIDAESAARCFEAGADGVAVVRADLGSTLRGLLGR